MEVRTEVDLSREGREQGQGRDEGVTEGKDKGEAGGKGRRRERVKARSRVSGLDRVRVKGRDRSKVGSGIEKQGRYKSRKNIGAWQGKGEGRAGRRRRQAREI